MVDAYSAGINGICPCCLLTLGLLATLSEASLDALAASFSTVFCAATQGQRKVESAGRAKQGKAESAGRAESAARAKQR